jgi:hypothetical protein
MNIPLPALIEALRCSLRDAVQPELQSDHARSQLAGVVDILGKLERMADWLPAVAREEQAALDDGLHAVASLAASADVSLPDGARPMAGDTPERTQERLRLLSDWLFEADIALDLRNEMEARLRSALRASLAAQRSLIPRADFSSMTASTT